MDFGRIHFGENRSYQKTQDPKTNSNYQIQQSHWLGKKNLLKVT
jgi:hypothetical protein